LKKKVTTFFLAFIFALSCILSYGLFTSANVIDGYYSVQNIKIGLESMQSANLTVTFNGNYTNGSKIFNSGTSLQMSVVNNKISFDGGLHDSFELRPVDASTTMALRIGTTTRRYQGNMLFRISGDRILPVNTLYIEDYLKGVVGYEMSDFYPIEALKAQAVAARNYAIVQRNRKISAGYNLCDTIQSQVYRGLDPSLTRVIRAVDETAGCVLVHNNSLVKGFFHASSGGYTENSENVWVEALPYLKARKDDFDGPGKYPDFFVRDKRGEWTRTFTTTQLETLLKQRSSSRFVSTDTFIRIDMESITKFDSGRIKNITLQYKDASGKELERHYGKESARTAFGFDSSLYNVVYDNSVDTYTFVGQGFGHGVGMSQIGAYNRALSGQTYNQILEFYYEGSTVRSLTSKINTFNIESFIHPGNRLASGDIITFNSSGVLGSGKGYVYKYLIEKDGQVLLERDFSSDSRVSYRTNSPGDYTARVFIRDILCSEGYEDTKTLSFSVIETGEADMNLDKRVDLYDLVEISRNIGKTKIENEKWYDRWNIDNSDDEINAKDVDKAAESYNRMY
jgi:SpoIID/LytB domain protein